MFNLRGSASLLTIVGVSVLTLTVLAPEGHASQYVYQLDYLEGTLGSVDYGSVTVNSVTGQPDELSVTVNLNDISGTQYYFATSTIHDVGPTASGDFYYTNTSPVLKTGSPTGNDPGNPSVSSSGTWSTIPSASGNYASTYGSFVGTLTQTSSSPVTSLTFTVTSGSPLAVTDFQENGSDYTFMANIQAGASATTSFTVGASGGSLAAPEPSSYAALLAGGLVGLLALRKRFVSKQSTQE